MPIPEIDADLLGEHFHSIRSTLIEVREFKTKKLKPTPTFELKKAVDIENAWPACRELFTEMFNMLNTIADYFKIPHGTFYANDPFVDAIDAFTEKLDTIVFGIADVLGTGIYSAKELVAIDERILQLQRNTNRLRKFVMEEFVYPSPSSRPPLKD